MNRHHARLTTLCLAAMLLFSGCFGGGGSRNARPDPKYSNDLHNRFYRAWVQPRAITAPPGRISVPVDVRIDESGRVASFKIAKRSGYAALDESIMAIPQRVTQVPPPPATTRRGMFRLRIFFDLDVR
jgi:TonB family protein